MQSLITTSFYWGYIVTQLLSGILAQKFGTKYLFAAATSIAAVVTVCLPSLARAGPAYLIIGRVITGAAQVGPTHPIQFNSIHYPLSNSNGSVGSGRLLPIDAQSSCQMGPTAATFFHVSLHLCWQSSGYHHRFTSVRIPYRNAGMGGHVLHRRTFGRHLLADVDDFSLRFSRPAPAYFRQRERLHRPGNGFRQAAREHLISPINIFQSMFQIL